MDTVYIETSIFSYLTGRPSRDLVAAARQQITIDWWEDHRYKYEIYISNVVVAEASQGDKLRMQARIDKIKEIPRLAVSSECLFLAEKMISESILPPKAKDDALHLAISGFHSMDFLLTWNCRHLANAHLASRFRAFFEQNGYKYPVICTPEELMGEYT
jgi:hypothetical protein